MVKKKTKQFPYAPENKVSPLDKFGYYMNEMKTDFCRNLKKLICDWTEKILQYIIEC